MKRVHRAPPIALLLLLVTAGCATSAPPGSAGAQIPAGRHSISGGGGAMASVTALTTAFSREHPGVTFVLDDIGSDGGVALAGAGKADLGMISRDLKDAERDLVQTVPVGLSGTGIIVNAANRIHGLTRAQARDVFSGKTTDWAELGGTPGRIRTFTREPDASTRSSFESYVYQGKGQYASDTVVINDLEAMLNAVAGFRGAVGIATLSEETLKNPSVRFLAIDGAEATRENLQAGAYPIRRPLFIVYRPEYLKPATAAFLEFVRSPEGQRIVSSF